MSRIVFPLKRFMFMFIYDKINLIRFKKLYNIYFYKLFTFVGVDGQPMRYKQYKFLSKILKSLGLISERYA